MRVPKPLARNADQQPPRHDAFTNFEINLVRLKFVIFEIVMLLCFLFVLYKVVRYEIGF